LGKNEVIIQASKLRLYAKWPAKFFPINEWVAVSLRKTGDVKWHESSLDKSRSHDDEDEMNS